ncbi:MAG: hypothetical protein WAV05_13260 [Anaerolineales bacterium]
MAPLDHRQQFRLEDLLHSAHEILANKPDAIVAWRLLRDVLHLAEDDPELVEAKEKALVSKWVHQLEETQLPDGSWGRFHSQDTKQKTTFRTSEEAIDRAFALGLEADHPILTQVQRYIQLVLQGQACVTDRDEKNEAWPLLIRLILAGRLAQINPNDELLDPIWSYMARVVQQAFTSGKYRLEDEVAAYQRLSKIHIPQGFLESQHALWILCSRALPNQLERALISWIWSKPDGIRYIRIPLYAPEHRRIGYWLRSMNLLTHFSSWREMSLDMLNQMWELRDEHGWWDFGSQVAGSVEFPLSENWRQSMRRKLDYSTSMLILLRKYFD